MQLSLVNHHSYRRFSDSGRMQSAHLFSKKDHFLYLNPSIYKILIVDDDPIVLQIHRSCLKKLGFQVDVDDTGKKAVNDFKYYDLIFLDIDLPDKSGIEICRDIREQSNQKQRPIIIALTSHGKDIATVCNESGFNALITKPITESVFRQILADWLIANDPVMRGKNPCENPQQYV